MYYEDLLGICDKKDELFEIFLDYYEEYFLNLPKKIPNMNSDLVRSYHKLSVKDDNSEDECLSDLDVEYNFGSVINNGSNENNNSNNIQNFKRNSEKTKQIKSKFARRKSSIYSYSIPTENRFSILSRTENGATLVKHF